MKGKTLGKRHRPDVEEKKVAKDVRTIKRMMQELPNADGTPHQMHKFSDMLRTRADDGVDHGYIRTLLFPELYSADIPQPMSTQSYCRFTDKKELSIISDGEGMLIWYPKVNNGPQLFLRKGGDVTTTPIPLEIGAGDTEWKWGSFQSFDSFFTMSTLVSASLSIQYIGQLQNEQGYMVASQSFGVNPDNLTADEIENGQFRCLSKPGDGMRTTYIPKDINDFQYVPCTPAKGTKIITRNGNSYGSDISYIKPVEFAIADQKKFCISGTEPNWLGTTRVDSGVTKFTSLEYGFNKDADFVAIYWKGLNKITAADLRIDVVRRFNGFPKADKRDYLDLNKPKKIFDPKKTIDVIQELQTAIPTVVTHSLKSMDRVSDQIQEFIPNLGHLYNEGALKDGTSLEGFATQLQNASGNDGAGTLPPVRLYD